jgi:hypothetical protein
MMVFERKVRLSDGSRSRDEPWRDRIPIVDAYHPLSATANLIPYCLCSLIKQHSKRLRSGRLHGRKSRSVYKLRAHGHGMSGDQWELPSLSRLRKGSGPRE